MFSINDLRAYCGLFYGGANVFISPYSYTASFDSIDAGVTQQRIINVAANGDFVLTGLAYALNPVGTAVEDTRAAMLKLQIEDTGSNEKFFNDECATENVCNNDWADSALGFPRFISGKTSLRVTLHNFSDEVNLSEGYLRIDVVLKGVLVRVFA